MKKSMAAFEVENLRKNFWIKERSKTVGEGVRALFKPKFLETHAVQGVTFSVEKGERVAFIGPNGAGKSTTIKMLTGILHPSSGKVSVLGCIPWKDRRKLGYKIGTVFGQRSQLWYHLPASDTFDLLACIYDQNPQQYRQRRAELVKIFDAQPLLDKPVRQLSLGERMRCELIASLLHRPEALFLDEPTIGLDVTAKAIIRDLVRDRSLQDGTTLLLTSHDTGDIERVCDRVLVINEGKLLLNEPIQALRANYIKKKVIALMTAEESIFLDLPGVKVLEKAPHRTVLEVDVTLTPVEKVVDAAMKASRLRDLTVEDPPMEEIIQQIYSSTGKTR
jgi:ABC-2 type transport system ATP-binding protein